MTIAGITDFAREIDFICRAESEPIEPDITAPDELYDFEHGSDDEWAWEEYAPAVGYCTFMCRYLKRDCTLEDARFAIDRLGLDDLDPVTVRDWTNEHLRGVITRLAA